jgi:hypothetical protein
MMVEHAYIAPILWIKTTDSVLITFGPQADNPDP